MIAIPQVFSPFQKGKNTRTISQKILITIHGVNPKQQHNFSTK
jgi:hypothetical protein